MVQSIHSSRKQQIITLKESQKNTLNEKMSVYLNKKEKQERNYALYMLITKEKEWTIYLHQTAANEHAKQTKNSQLGEMGERMERVDQAARETKDDIFFPLKSRKLNQRLELYSKQVFFDESIWQPQQQHCKI